MWPWAGGENDAARAKKGFIAGVAAGAAAVVAAGVAGCCRCVSFMFARYARLVGKTFKTVSIPCLNGAEASILGKDVETHKSSPYCTRAGYNRCT